VSEVAIVLDKYDEEQIGPRDIVLHKVDGGIKHVTNLFPGYLALRFPIFFPMGEQGWVSNFVLRSRIG
jgi:hypothetical protein